MRKILRNLTGKSARKYEEGFAGVHYCTNHGGKMEGVQSVSSSCLNNPFCLENMKNGMSICSKCYSASIQTSFRGNNITPLLKKNTEILSTRELQDEEVPIFTSALGRIESFGDVCNALQACNYIKIARLNPQTKFAAWTKNLNAWKRAVMAVGKPENLQIVYSSPLINVQIKHLPDFVDKVFTVYDAEGVSAQGVTINCGARSCVTCRRCYEKNPEGVKLQAINEFVKSIR